MRSICFDKFKTRVGYFDDDIELIDVLKSEISRGSLTDPKSKHVIKGLNAETHSHLARRQNSVGSRKLIINHLRKTVYCGYVKDLYEEVTEYLRSIIKFSSEKGINSARLIGEHGFKVDAKVLLELGSWDNVLSYVTDSLFQSMESERSTLKLIEKVASKLALEIDKNIIKEAQAYLEVRHFLVHSDGKIPQEFKYSNPAIEVDRYGYVVLSYKFISSYRKSVFDLISGFDREVVRLNLLKEKRYVGNNRN